MNGEVRVVDDVASAFAELVRETFDATPGDVSLALSGGSTAGACYGALAKESIDWSRVTMVWGDERCVPLDHADSNYLLAKDWMLDSIPPPKSVLPMRAEAAAAAYEAAIAPLMPITVVHLGMGDDGHTASLFPGSPALESPPERLVVETGDEFHPHPRMTFTFSALDQSNLAVFTVSGANKREMFQRIRNGEPFPAGRVAAHRVVWLVDHAAYGD